MKTKTVYAFILLALLPAVPLFVTWQRLRKDGARESAVALLPSRIGVVLTTLSFILLLTSLIWSPVLGPDYSRRRFAVIYANTILVAIVFLFGLRRFKLPLIIASCIVALEWLYLAVVSSVV